MAYGCEANPQYPLSLRHPEDKRICNFKRDREFSVRFAYHLLQQTKSAKRPGPSCTLYKKLWKLIWHFPVLPKVRNFLWRLARNILRTKVYLQDKGVNLNYSCSFCHTAPESIDHLFMYYNFVKVTCFCSPMGYRIPPAMYINDWLLSFLDDKNLPSS